MERSWKVAAAEGNPGGYCHKSSSAPTSTVLVPADAIQSYPHTAGTISPRLKAGGVRTLANANVFFDALDEDHYRMVRLKRKATGWFLQLLQKGAYDGDTERTASSLKLPGFTKKHWHPLEITVGADGSVSAQLSDEEDGTKIWTLNGSFAQNTGGDVGIFTKGTVLLVDDYIPRLPAA